jgi:putative DNA primase/helicase
MTTPAETVQDLIRRGKVSPFPNGQPHNGKPWTPIDAPPVVIAPLDGTLKVARLSSVKAKPIRPLWAGCLYHGKVTVVAGIPGDGKSLISTDLVARISAGKHHPVGDGKFKVAPCLLLTAEDDPADTIRPRLDQAGADNELVELIEGVHRVDPVSGEKGLDLVSLINDLPAIERKIDELKAALLVIDPLTSFADSDTNKTADMRRLLDGLAQMAARTGAAILVITHLNKRSDARKAMQMIAGSHVIVAAVRVVLVTARDPNDKGRRLLLPIKCNIGPDSLGFAFRVIPKTHTVCGDVPVAEWETEKVGDLSADDVLIDSTPRAQAAVEKSTEVCDWLKDLLRKEPVEGRVMWEKAKAKDYGERRVKSALKMIGATCEVLGYQGKWHYRLPESDKKDAHV